MFIQEFTTLLETLATYNSQLVVTGDLNIHMEDMECSWASQVKRIINSFGLRQHVDFPTHTHGGWLDLVITRDDCGTIAVASEPPSISGHSLLMYHVPFLHSAPLVTEITFRGWKSLDREAFRQRLTDSQLCCASAGTDLTATDMFDLYETTLRSIIDEMLPMRTARVRSNALTPWFDAECRAMRRTVRRSERRYRRSGQEEDRLEWIRLLRKKSSDFKVKEQDYWESLIARDSKDSRRLWNDLSTILGRSRCSQGPEFPPEDFLRHLLKKVSDVRRDTEGAAPPEYSETQCRFERFEQVTESELKALLLSSPSKTCKLDPIPAFLLKEFIDELLPFLAQLCNTSLAEGCLPESQKRAIIRPEIKKPGLDSDNINNYRPISNLTFLSKIIEKVVVRQLVPYLESSTLMPKLQSGFRKGHSTETVLLRLISDVCDAIDAGHVTLLALLDVSAAFDTVDHGILLTRLRTSFGVVGQALQWVQSFLSGRQMMVVVGSGCSSWAPVTFGVPQGSVLGPLLYVLYTADLTSIISALGARVHQYADDAQLYLTCHPSDALACVSKMEEIVKEVQTWMSSNRLRLNPDKTEFIWLGTGHARSRIDARAIEAAFPNWKTKRVVRDLGVLLDEDLSMDQHVGSLCRSCFYQLRQIRVIRRNLSHEAAATLVHSFVLNRLDFCNAVLAGLPKYQIRQLQSVLNCAARVVADLPKFSHISTYMRDTLHWLPVVDRITFKIIVMGRASMAGLAPEYMRELCIPVSNQPGRRSLRSATRGDLIVPRSRKVFRSNRAFSCIGPSCWNSLPLTIRDTALLVSHKTFSKTIKTHLFRTVR
jgi:hypothetical protein